MDDQLYGRIPAAIRMLPTDESMLAVFRERVSFDLPDDIIPFLWQAQISNNRLDSHFTHMSEKTLRNFAQDARAGVSFLDSHNDNALGYGQSYDGQFLIGGSELTPQTNASFYTVSGIRFGAALTYASTDDFITAVKAQMTRQVSVGFFDGDWICDLCGNSVWGQTECIHFPGVVYPVGEQGEETKTATAQIDGARLAEVSSVFKGATPGAAIEKANRMFIDGKLPDLQAAQIQKRYDITLKPDRGWALNKEVQPEKTEGQTEKGGKKTMSDQVDGSHTYPIVVGLPDEVEVTPLTDDEGQELVPVSAAEDIELVEPEPEVLAAPTDNLAEDVIEEVNAVIEGLNAVLPADRQISQIKSAGLSGVLATLPLIRASVSSILPSVKDGQAYRKAIIKEALTEGVRALGAGFEKERFSILLNDMTVPNILVMRGTWASVSSKRFKNKNSISQSEDIDEIQTSAKVPISAYKS